MDIEGEIARLTKDLEKAEGELKRVNGKLSNQGFIAKAPAALVEAENAKKAKFEALIADLTRAALGEIAISTEPNLKTSCPGADMLQNDWLGRGNGEKY